MITSNIAIPAVVALAVYGVAFGLEQTVPTAPTQASLKSLTVNQGIFRQEFFVSGEGFIDMNWTAEINRGVAQLCSGGGRAPYRNETPKTFNANDWTFDDCPPLMVGDEGFAVWSYTDDEGVGHKFSATIILTEEML